MVAIMRGVVKEGRIIPERPLPEGETVAIGLLSSASSALDNDFDSWVLGSNKTLAEMEEMLEKEMADGTR